MIKVFFLEVRALIRFNDLLKKGNINEAAVAYQEYQKRSDEVEKLVMGKLEEAKASFVNHTTAVEKLKQLFG